MRKDCFLPYGYSTTSQNKLDSYGWPAMDSMLQYNYFLFCSACLTRQSKLIQKASLKMCSGLNQEALNQGVGFVWVFLALFNKLPKKKTIISKLTWSVKSSIMKYLWASSALTAVKL